MLLLLVAMLRMSVLILIVKLMVKLMMKLIRKVMMVRAEITMMIVKTMTKNIMKLETIDNVDADDCDDLIAVLDMVMVSTLTIIWQQCYALLSRAEQC